MEILTVGPASTYPTIAAALAVAVPGDTIWLEAGYSNEVATVLTNRITIEGSAASTGIVLQLGAGVTGLTLAGAAPINVLDSGGGSSAIAGNAGDNVITVSGGVDVVNGGLGNDRLVVDYSTATGTTVGDSTTSFIGAGVGSVTIGTGFEHFTIKTGMGVNTITTGAGDDIITANNTVANTIVAGEGNNIIITGSGVDTINTGFGNDKILAGEGASTIVDTGGNNFIVTGSGVDTVTVGAGFDRIFGGDGANTITGLAGNKIIVTGAGADTITVTSGNNIILAGDGANTITATTGHNTIIGGSGADTITTGDGGNYIDAGAGANTIASGGGNDTIITGVGADTIATGGGNDKILITGGADVIAAGAGVDTLVVDYSAATAAVTTGAPGGTFAAGYVGTINGGGAVTYAGIENFDITTGSGNDSISTGDGNDIINTGTGIDLINAGAGSDYIYGNAGDVINGGEGGTDGDTLNLFGTGAYSILYDPLNGENGVVTFLDGTGFPTDGTLAFANIENVVSVAPLPPTVVILAPGPALYAPVVGTSQVAGTVVEAGSLDNGTAVAGTPTASGTMVSSDVDSGATQTWSTPAAAADSPYGSFAITAAGVWTYTLDNAAAGTLAEGSSATESFTVTVTDEFGATASQTVTLTLTGTNDAPVIGAALTSTAAEGQAGYSLDLLAGASDVDSGQTATLSVQNVIGLAAGVTLSGNNLLIDPAHAALQSLAVGESVRINVTYDVVDAQGAAVAQSALVTLTGTNDAPAFSMSSVTTGAVTSGVFLPGTLVTNGNFEAIDIADDFVAGGSFAGWTPIAGAPLSTAGFADLPAGLIVEPVGTPADNQVGFINPDGALRSIIGTLSTDPAFVVGFDVFTRLDSFGGARFAVDVLIDGVNVGVRQTGVGPANGGYSHFDLSFDLSALNLSAYTPGVSVVSLAFSNIATNTQFTFDNVTVGPSLPLVGTEGALQFTDIDSSDSHSISVTDFAPGYLGQFTATMTADATGGNTGQVNWSFVADDRSLDFLAAGEQRTQTYVVTLADGNGGTATQTVTVTLTGDAGTISGNAVTIPDVFTGAIPYDSDDLATGGAGGITLIGTYADDWLVGGAGADLILGDVGNDMIIGGAGNDTIDGGSNVDQIFGGSGNDSINGNNFFDYIYGGSGADTLTGGPGNDSFVLMATTDTGDTITDFTSTEDWINLSNIDANISDIGDQDFAFGGTTATANGVWYEVSGGNSTVYVDTNGNASNAELVIYLTDVTSLEAFDFYL